MPKKYDEAIMRAQEGLAYEETFKSCHTVAKRRRISQDDSRPSQLQQKDSGKQGSIDTQCHLASTATRMPIDLNIRARWKEGMMGPGVEE